MADRATRPRYLECPGQHPHRPSLHGLPLLQMRRSTVSPGPHGTRREPGRHGRREAAALRGAGLGVAGPPSRSRPREDRAEAARKASRWPGEENSALFLERKKIPASFLQKYLFLPKSEFGATSFKRCIIFCYIHANEKIIHGLRLCTTHVLDGQRPGKHSRRGGNVQFGFTR